MKKTLVALAALTATGVFAQVTITGTIAMGYKQSFNPQMTAANTAISSLGNALLGGLNGNARGDSSGFGVDTSEIYFTAKEDLGGGYNIEGMLGFGDVTRGGVSGGDTALKLMTPVGRLSLQSYKPADYLSGGVSGVAGIGFDNKIFQARSYKDSVGFDTKVGPVYVGLSQYESGPSTNTATAAAKANEKLGLGVGASGTPDTIGQRINSLSLTYVGGGLIANVNYLMYDNRDTNNALVVGGATLSDKSTKDVVRTAISYDLGWMKLGAGYSLGSQMSGATIADGILGASVPLGSLTIGASYASSTLANVSANTTAGLGKSVGDADGTRSGYGLNATYALSKRTSVSATYTNWLSVPVATDRSSETSILLAHSF